MWSIFNKCLCLLRTSYQVSKTSRYIALKLLTRHLNVISFKIFARTFSCGGEVDELSRGTKGYWLETFEFITGANSIDVRERRDPAVYFGVVLFL